MHFSKIFAAGAVMAASTMAAVTTSQVIDGLQSLTVQSQNLEALAQTINPTTAVQIAVGQGPFPPIINGLQEIAQTSNDLVSQFSGTVPVANDAPAIFDAYRNFVRVHQQFLNTMIGKAGVVEQFPFIAQPVSAALRQDERVVDTLSFSMIDIAPLEANAIQSNSDSLDQTLSLAVDKYSSI